MQLFYSPDIQTTKTLSAQESHHAIKVLRLSTDAILHVVDGYGSLFKVRITDAHHKACKVDILETITEQHKRPYHLHMAVAPTKNIDRFEWFIEKATEMGIDEITPLLCEHSERKIIKPERLEKVIISAMKQSLKSYKPILHKLTSFNEFVNKNKSENLLFIAHCYNSEKEIIKNCITHKSYNSIQILIGPEGDFSKAEVDLAVAKKYMEISLGKSRLRTETAAVAACHSIYHEYL